MQFDQVSVGKKANVFFDGKCVSHTVTLPAYTARLSPTVVANLLAELLHARGGSITAGEVGLPIQRDGKVLPCGIYGRWEA